MTTKRHLQALHAVLGEVLDGLAGRPFSWGSGERLSKRGLLYELGVELVTETAAKKLGHRLRRSAAPVGSVYFNAPISQSRPVYVLHVQTSPVERPAREGSEAGANTGESFTTSRPGLVPVQREVPADCSDIDIASAVDDIRGRGSLVVALIRGRIRKREEG